MPKITRPVSERSSSAAFELGAILVRHSLRSEDKTYNDRSRLKSASQRASNPRLKDLMPGILHATDGGRVKCESITHTQNALRRFLEPSF